MAKDNGTAIKDQKHFEHVRFALDEIKRTVFVSGYEATDAEAFGILVSKWFKWDPDQILKTAYAAFEYANMHTENETVREWIDGNKTNKEARMNLSVEVIDTRKIVGDGSLKAFCDVKIGGDLLIKGFSVMNGKKGLFVCCPRKASKDGRWFDILEMSDELRTKIETKILEAYEKEK